jgi:hypothetical protein
VKKFYRNILPKLANLDLNNATGKGTGATIGVTTSAAVPFYKEWWFWAGVGVVAIGAICVYVYIKQQRKKSIEKAIQDVDFDLSSEGSSGLEDYSDQHIIDRGIHDSLGRAGRDKLLHGDGPGALAA